MGYLYLSRLPSLMMLLRSYVAIAPAPLLFGQEAKPASIVCQEALRLVADYTQQEPPLF